MSKAKARNKDRPAARKSVAAKTERKRSERAMQVGATNRWSFVWWTLPALAFGFLMQFSYYAVNNYLAAADRIGIGTAFVATLALCLVTAVPTFLLVLGTARSAFTKRPIRETLSRFNTKNKWFDSLLASLIWPVLVASMVATSFPNGADIISWTWVVLMASAFFPIYKALTFAYREQYTEFTLDPSELNKLSSEMEAYKKLSLREKIKSFRLKRLVPRRDRMVMPIFQSVMVWLTPSLVTSLVIAITIFGGKTVDDGRYATVTEILTPISYLLLMASTVVWSKWHLRGGIGRILRVSNGRPLEPLY